MCRGTAAPCESTPPNQKLHSSQLLVEQNTAVKANLEEVKDDQKKQNLSKLDEQAKTLQLREEVESLQFEIDAAEEEKDLIQKKIRESDDRHENDKEKLRDELKDIKKLADSYKAKMER